jgi:hypothetical protein
VRLRRGELMKFKYMREERWGNEIIKKGRRNARGWKESVK